MVKTATSAKLRFAIVTVIPYLPVRGARGTSLSLRRMGFGRKGGEGRLNLSPPSLLSFNT
jgi:hypothetical protein